MYNHAPKNYKCPFCLVKKNFNKHFILHRDKGITSFISNMEWPPNSGIVLVVPNKHFENLYEIPVKLLAKIHVYSKKLALAMKKTYKCDGILIRQHNEPIGNQTVFHYHIQIVPRYNKDNFYGRSYKTGREISEKNRWKYFHLIKKQIHG
ncbi:MAG: HIT domain-containing protein [Candidatus Doudnabacteria bacterium]|nr:HIT domain-containing protein [Candidatus Doudnabacteria bacterium]